MSNDIKSLQYKMYAMKGKMDFVGALQWRDSARQFSVLTGQNLFDSTFGSTQRMWLTVLLDMDDVKLRDMEKNEFINLFMSKMTPVTRCETLDILSGLEKRQIVEVEMDEVERFVGLFKLVIDNVPTEAMPSEKALVDVFVRKMPDDELRELLKKEKPATIKSAMKQTCELLKQVRVKNSVTAQNNDKLWDMIGIVVMATVLFLSVIFVVDISKKNK